MLKNDPLCGQVTLAGYGLNKCHFFDPDHYQIYEVSSGSLSKNPCKLLQAGMKILKGIFQSIQFFKKNPIDIVVGLGSYHAFPVLFAAKLCRKKILLYEQNTIMGQVNRIFASSSTVALQLPTEKMYKNSVFVTFAHKENPPPKQYNPNPKTILIFGGSQGAQFFNEFFHQITPHLSGYHIFHLTGNDQATHICQNQYDQYQIKATVSSYEPDMHKLYTQSDFAICRAGSNTLQELIHYNVPAILIPYPYAKSQHQTTNARFFQNVVGGGTYIEQNDINKDFFLFLLGEFVQSLPKYFDNLTNYKQQNHPNAKQLLSDLIVQMGVKK